MWRMTEEEARRYGLLGNDESEKKKKRRNKYNARRTSVDGVSFDSAAEAAYYQELKLRLRAGEIAGFCRQPRFMLDAGTEYRADFIVFHVDGSYDIIDVKGVETSVFKLKMAMMRERYPGLEIRKVSR